ncbi:MAG: OmpA family protein [Pseudomonadota bacterium]
MKHVLTLIACLALPTMASAQQAQYSADDITKHFDTTNEAAAAPACPEGQLCLQKKNTRAVCIGAASACAGQQAAQAAAKPPSAFDLLITFELGSDRLSTQAQQNLSEFAKALNSDKLRETTFNVDGHTDASGNDDFNMTLSQRRAASVVRFLTELGVDANRLKARGHGESAPRDADPFAAINRRVEATINIQ